MPIMSLRAFARTNHLDPTTVRRWIAQGMPALRDGHRWRIPATEAEAWLAAQAQAQRPAEPSRAQEVTQV
jgi:excisionase family DNA binding protein